MVRKRGDHVVKRSTAASSRWEEDVGKITSTTAVEGNQFGDSIGTALALRDKDAGNVRRRTWI